MKSDAWKRLRHAKLESVKWKCEDCHDARASQVHHDTYARFGGEEWLADLRALCRDCHKRVHRVIKQHRGLWFSSRIAAAHAMTQFGVDIREQLLASYTHG